MEIIILSLPNSPRREYISNLLINLGVNNFCFFDAFDARKLCQNKLQSVFLYSRFSERYNREPKKGEIGCTISHLKIWEYISSQEQDNYIVLEDDAFFDEKLPLFIEQASNGMESLPINSLLLLGHSKTEMRTFWWQKIKEPLLDKIKVGNLVFGKKPYIKTCGTVGYYLNRETANYLSCNLNTPFWLADDFYFYSSNGINVLHPHNPIVWEDFRSESSIGNTYINPHDFRLNIFRNLKVAIGLNLLFRLPFYRYIVRILKRC